MEDNKNSNSNNAPQQAKPIDLTSVGGKSILPAPATLLRSPAPVRAFDGIEKHGRGNAR